ncbi:hypothetical protein ZWY2020_025833 [Hordeum vulgare]|nr:hypothetical protein ZWY2020_025833 [Hordeum vulgare]
MQAVLPYLIVLPACVLAKTIGRRQMAVKVVGCAPPRKYRNAGGDPEEPCRQLQAESRKSTSAWAVLTVRISVRSLCFRSSLLLVVVLFVVTGISVTSKDSAGELPSVPPPPAAAISATTTRSSGFTAAEPPTVSTPPAAAVSALTNRSSEVTAAEPPTVAAAGGGPGVDECDMSSGRWVYDEEAYPLYKESACRFMSENLACGKYGRTDLRYQHWRWQPHGCDLPRFDAARLLEKLRRKRLAFVGDSLNRNQWVSMVCLIDTATPGLHKTLDSTGSLVSFNVHEYNASVDFYWSPLLVESNSDHPVHHRVADRTVRAASIVKHARHWTNADVLVFNSYLWWRRPSIKVRWGSFETPAAKEDEHYGVTKAVDGVRAFELALTTWADWLEFHVDRARTRLFFVTMSPTHLPSDELGDDAGGGASHGCYNETEPIAAAEEGGRYQRGDMDPAFARAVEEQARRLGARGVAVRLVKVTGMSERRKDAHPSVHRRQWDPITDAQARDPSSYADCIHWCLPGVPDVWNHLLYAHIVS